MSSLQAPTMLAPTHGKGHHHRRSAAISLDWRHVTLPPVEAPLKTAQSLPSNYSPTLTFASTLSDTSVEEESGVMPTPSMQLSMQTTMSFRKRVSFVDDVEEIPAGDIGDTWMKPEDYSWPIPSADSKTILLDPVEPCIDLAPALAKHVPGSPVLMHRKKRSSLLQSTKNALNRRPSKKESKAVAESMFDVPVPAPKSSMIDLDLVFAPNTSLRHKKSGSLGAFSGLPASPTKPKAWHRRADSAPADIVFSFSPRPASPDSRKRKMSSIVEHPASHQNASSPSTLKETALAPSSLRSTGIIQVMADDMIIGEPGDMVSSGDCLDSPAIAALKSHSISRKGSKKGWRGMLHRLLH